MFKYTFCLLNILIGAWASQESFDLAINARVIDSKKMFK
jgi:hypothetical protein